MHLAQYTMTSLLKLKTHAIDILQVLTEEKANIA